MCNASYFIDTHRVLCEPHSYAITMRTPRIPLTLAAYMRVFIYLYLNTRDQKPRRSSHEHFCEHRLYSPTPCPSTGICKRPEQVRVLAAGLGTVLNWFSVANNPALSWSPFGSPFRTTGYPVRLLNSTPPPHPVHSGSRRTGVTVDGRLKNRSVKMLILIPRCETHLSRSRLRSSRKISLRYRENLRVAQHFLDYFPSKNIDSRRCSPAM